jgi:Tol biopolymer transport system component
LADEPQNAASPCPLTPRYTECGVLIDGDGVVFAIMKRGLVISVLATCILVSGLALGVGRLQPHGRELLYTSYNGSRTWASRLDVDRGLHVRLSPFGSGFQWSPDGEQIAFTANVDGDNDLFVMDAMGRGVRPMTDNTLGDYDPVWSPDGTRIAYISYAGGAGTDIYVINADGSNPRKVSGDQGSNANPVWSADGQQIAFERRWNGTFNMFVTDLNSDAIQLFDSTFTTILSLSWSPDGQQVAFAGADVENQTDIFVRNRDGGEARNLTLNQATAGWPIWSPDSQTIAYYSWPSVANDIFVHDVETGETHNLTNTFANETNAVWSLDGRQIAFTSGDERNAEIYLIEVDTGQITRLTHNRVRDYAPLWRP